MGQRNEERERMEEISETGKSMLNSAKQTQSIASDFFSDLLVPHFLFSSRRLFGFLYGVDFKIERTSKIHFVYVY